MRAKLCFLTSIGVLLAGCAASPLAKSSPTDWLNRVQPFVNRPAPEYRAPQVGPSPFPTSAHPCQARQLRAVGSRGGVGLGNILYQVTFTNVSQAPCQLSGTPLVQGLDPAGQLVTVPMTLGTYFLDPIAADIMPGEAGYLNIGMADSRNCPGAPAAVTYSQLSFGLPGGGWISTDISVTRACDVLTISVLGKTPGPVVDPSPGPGSIGMLRARVEGFPQQAQPGTTLGFVVVLTNPTDLAVTLSPCPSYTEIINARPRSRYLNCDHVTVIPPGGSVRYAMELDIPQEIPLQVPPVLTKWAWILNVPHPSPRVGGVLILQR